MVLPKFKVFRFDEKIKVVCGFFVFCVCASANYCQGEDLTERANLGKANCVQYDIPSQNLHLSLSTIAQLNRLSLAYNPRWAEQYSAPRLTGSFCSAEALYFVLAELPVEVQIIGAGFVLKQKVAPKSNLSTGANRFEETYTVGKLITVEDEASRLKQRADNSREIILSTDIAKFPAENVAEALNRLPGISVERDRGQALFISVNGLPSNFNQTTLNGLPIATNENTRTSEQFGTRFHYHTMPAELVSRVDVSKTPKAESTEGAIGGHININTHQALKKSESKNTVKLSTNHMELAEKMGGSATIVNGWENSDRDFGVVFAANFDERNIRQDRFLAFDWRIDDNDLFDSSDSIIYAPGLRPTLEKETRERFGLTGSFAWKPLAGNTFNLDVIILNQEINYLENTYSADYSLADLDESSIVWDGNIITGGRTSRGSVQIGKESAGLLDKTVAFDLRHQWAGSTWDIASDIRLSRADSRTREPIRRTRFRRENSVDFSFMIPGDYENGLPSIDYSNIDLVDASDFPARRLESRRIDSTDQLHTARAIFSRSLSTKGFSEVKFGLEARNHSRDYGREDEIFTNNFLGRVFAQENFELLGDDFLSATDSLLPRSWLSPIESYFWKEFGFSDNADIDLQNRDKLNSYNVSEEILGSYFQLGIKYHNLDGNLGIRYIADCLKSEGYFQDNSQESILQPVVFKRNENYVLPSLNIKYEFSKNWQIRTAVSRALNRPDTSDLAPRLTINSGDSLNALGGNPYLEPVFSWQFDFSIEQYRKMIDNYSAYFFYKKLDGFIQPSSSNFVINDIPYQVNTVSNGSQADIAGINVSYNRYLYPFDLYGHRIGVSLNFSYTHSNAQYNREDRQFYSELEGVAKRSMNAQFLYEADQFAARINYSWTGEVLDDVGSSTEPARYRASFGTLSMSSSFILKDKLEFIAEASNVLGDAEIEYVLDRKITNYTYYGPTYSLGFIYRY